MLYAGTIICSHVNLSLFLFLVILLASTSADERVDSQISGTKLRYLDNGLTEKNSDFKKLGWIEMERKINFPSRATNDQEKNNESLFLPSSGYTKSFFLKCIDPEKEYKAISLRTFYGYFSWKQRCHFRKGIQMYSNFENAIVNIHPENF